MTTSRDYMDMLGGAVLTVFGLWFMLHAFGEYNIGELRRMGPGFFPAVLGGLVAGFGALIFLPALFRAGTRVQFDTRPFLAIVAGILAFAFVVEPFGLVAATAVLVGITAMGRVAIRPVEIAIMAVCLAAIAVLVFSWGLGIPLHPFRWNF
ncbi:tripartite tricarboxylate transporter TctB family protein [Sabulicella glaciei]|uniref:Tripartite tricarboxylate transporter TctB family protein n=1 Tax=Sabulicella glaciei TaxID=2984948 RepID=A0ABT3NT69_9PROT|nr:tripartite tricarboxylate transporter TctB family protein [Roseococcus sp. MDT2-1-1]MCW8085363.1 tripartite tricarboxylate transporter TctB family protein [Roseococcus sp. MDT2-1-1]